MAVQGVPIENPAALFRATHGAPMRTVSGRTGRRQMRINRPCAQRAERIRAACRAAALRDPRHVSVVRAARATRLRCLPRGDPPPNPRLTQLMPKKGGLAMARKCNCTELLRAGLTSVEPLFEFRRGLALSLYEQRKKFDLATHLNAVLVEQLVVFEEADRFRPNLPSDTGFLKAWSVMRASNRPAAKACRA
jgi:hypothetical protein